MHPLEPKKPEQTIGLNLIVGAFVCAAVPLVSLVVGILLFMPRDIASMVALTGQLLLLNSLGFFTLRLFQLCDMRHLALSLIPIALGLGIFGFLYLQASNLVGAPAVLRPVIVGAAVMPLIVAVGVLFVAGSLGSAIGGWLSRRTDAHPHRSAIRLTTVALLASLLLAPPLYRLLVIEVSAAKAKVAGPAQLRANVSALRRTIISPTLDAPLAPGTNVIWCGTMQLAWNALCDLAGEEIRMDDEAPAVGQLNRRVVTASDLDADTYLVAAAPANDSAFRDLRSRVTRKFSGAVVSEQIPDPASLPPNTVMLYAVLFANLPFDKAFNRLERPFQFGEADVAAFGTEGELSNNERERAIRMQVLVSDFQDADDFIVELQTKLANHQLILAKVHPAATLELTIQSALKRVANHPPQVQTWYKRLVIPITDYDLTRPYPELINRPLRVKNPLIADMPLVAAIQSIRFKLDERGAVVKSEAMLGVKSASALPDELQDLVFDKPFLVLLKLASSDKPYFAMWVDNPEILARYAEPRR